MEVEGGPPKAREESNRRRKRRVCLFSTAFFLIAILLLFLILALTVFKPKRPITTINSISLSDLNLSFKGLLSLSLNVSLAVDLTIRNPNKVGFQYGNSSAFLDYRSQDVGEAPIPAGQISAGETLPLNLTLTIMADRFVSDSHALSDVMSGSLPLSAHTELKGRVSILGFIHIRVVSHTVCSFNVSIASRNISHNSCTYKTKL